MEARDGRRNVRSTTRSVAANEGSSSFIRPEFEVRPRRNLKSERNLGLASGMAPTADIYAGPKPINSDKPPVKGKQHGHVADALTATVARHLAKADPLARKAVLEAVLRLAREPNAATIGAFAEGITAAPLNAGARRSVIGAVMNALPRSLGPAFGPPEEEASAGADQAAEVSLALNKRIHKGRHNTGRGHNTGRRNTGMGRNHRSGAQPR